MKSFVKTAVITLAISVFLFGCGTKENDNPTNNSSDVSILTEATSENRETKSQAAETGGESVLTESKETEVFSENSKSESVTQESSEAVSSGDGKSSYKVVFVDDNGDPIKTDVVEKGEDAVPPTDPEKDGYEFKNWNYNFEDIQSDLTIWPVFEEITEPALIVKNISALPGDEIDIPVRIYKNPGFLGLVVHIEYDEKALKLTDVSSGSMMDTYTFTPPKNMKSGCNAGWNTVDIPEDELNGELMILHFKVDDHAKAGNYSVAVSCLNNAFDDSYNSFSFKAIAGSVAVK